MTATDIRNANFETLRDSLAERRRDVYRAFVQFGPCTTLALADKSGIGLLTLRPRATELLELGLLCVAGEEHIEGKRHGVYAATDRATWLAWREKNFPKDGQLQMGLNQGALTT